MSRAETPRRDLISEAVGHHEDDNTAAAELKFGILDDPVLRVNYVNLTSRLVDEILKVKADTVIFLDKSARPVEWMVDKLWPLLAGTYGNNGLDGTVPPKPNMRFLNIDRETWRSYTGSSESDEGSIKFDDPFVDEAIRDLRAALMVQPDDVNARGDEFDRPSMLDNKRIMVVDEVRVSGDTLDIAEGLVRAAASGSKVVGSHWMKPAIVTDPRSGARMNDDIPVWYSSQSELGRGIGDLSVTHNEQSYNRRIHRGRRFFSAPLTRMDDKSKKLRSDVSNLLPEIEAGLVPLRLNLQGVDEATRDYRLALMEKVNGLPLKKVVSVMNSPMVRLRPDSLPAVFKEAKEAAEAT